MGKHIKMLIKPQLKKGGCKECQSSCQTACKTSATVSHQPCENEDD
ncbi:MAG: six-cysteine ranthipeptide SCIFF [Candidatus Eremiobacteraeota bacterium]|nr:six-cysteine ranthipeptide SCIFF [Candidatus Eremiobacteraeota bacterium]